MSISYSTFSSISTPLLAFTALLLQLITLCTSWWATFTARTDLGKPEENGHYGLWTLCSTKGPRWKEDCDPLDTFFEIPPFITVSGILCIIHLVLIVIFIPLCLVRTAQVLKNESNMCINAKKLCIIEASVSLSSTFIVILVAVFASIAEKDHKEYSIFKGWSFWIQVFIIFLDFAIFLLCLMECIRFWQLQRQQQIDPEGKRAETYGNPTFDADSPELPRFQPFNNGAIAFTESSGNPYGINPAPENNPKNGRKGDKHKRENPSETLTYENECYLESSPRSRRRQ